MNHIVYDEFLSLVQTFVKQKDWDGLELWFNQYCAYFVSAEVAAAIKNVDLTECGHYLTHKAKEALALCKTYDVKAVYYEYNMLNDWASQFYICPEYNLIENNDDSWIKNFIPLGDELEGFEPSADSNSFEFSKALFECENIEERTAVEYYLAVRTTALFGRAITGIDFGNIALCCGFHDQKIVTRMYEPHYIKIEG